MYADALAQNDGIKNGKYNVLISNPPYSVKGFLEMLSDEERASFEITDLIDKKSIHSNNSIEAFFVERAKQLLAPGGVAAIILPSSILSNGGAVYTKTREIMLQYFDIVAIAEFGSGTFGKTGTNTVTLFLRRKNENPSVAEHYKNRVSAWFSGDFEKDDVFGDSDLLEAYCSYSNYELKDYKTLLQNNPNQAILNIDAFKAYRAVFDGTSEIKSLKTKQFFKRMTKTDKLAELNKRFVEYVRSIEHEKLYYFILAYTNPQDVAVVKSPSGTEIKKFLGYEWSSAKGNEGIKYIGVAQVDEKGVPITGRKGINGISTPLFNPLDLTDASKINSIIRANFNGVSVGESEFVTRSRLVDMIDFSGVKLEKQISLTSAKTLTIDTKYPLYELDKKAAINPSKLEISHISDETVVSFVEMASVSNNGYIDRMVDRTLGELRHAGYTYFIENDIIIAKITPCYENGKCALASGLTNGIGMGSTEFHVIRSGKDLLSKYLFLILNQEFVRNVGTSRMTGSSGHRRVPDSFFRQLRIPVPPIPIQEQLVAACEAVDEESSRIRMSIEEYRNRIEKLFNDIEIIIVGGVLLDDSTLFEVSIGKRVVETELISNGKVPVYSANVFSPFGYIDNLLITEFSVPSVLWGIDGDWQVNYMPENEPFYPTDHCGVLRVKNEKKIHPRYLAWALNKAGISRGFTRSLRASIDRVKRLKIDLPDQQSQKKVVDEVLKLEQQIVAAEQSLHELESKRQGILASNLK